MTRATRGLATRLAGVLLGAATAVALILAMVWPLASVATTFQRATTPLPLETPVSLAYPAVGSAAYVVPAAGLHGDERGTEIVPIASLTKMMTAYVVLHALPLRAGQEGPCVTLGPADVADYESKSSTDQSSIPVAAGERICELDLVKGLLVHSASNYADILARMVEGSTGPSAVTKFVDRMNVEAARLGLRHTHYVDDAGFDAGSVSSAIDQVRLASLLMESSLVRTIVDETSVVEPVAGVESSFTPLVGVDHVVGVKSGRTTAAGGCDAMAMTFQLDGRTALVYVVVLGARGGDLLTPAGNEALALANSVLASKQQITLTPTRVVGTLGWRGDRVAVTVARTYHVAWFGRSALSIHVTAVHHALPRGTVVGWLWLRPSTRRVALVVAHTLQPPSWWQRLR